MAAFDVACSNRAGAALLHMALLRTKINLRNVPSIGDAQAALAWLK
jgi:hypothetical protein